MMLVPSTTIEPRSGRSSPIRDFRNTDLPVPEGPSRTLTSPSGTSSVTSSQIRWGPKDLVNPSTWIPMPTRDPSAKCCPRHLPPACGLSHCSLRRSAATLVRGHILGACKYDCGADLFARSTPQCAFVGTADVCVCRHRRRVRLSAPPTCAFVGTADVRGNYLTVTAGPAASTLALASSAASLVTFSSSDLGALSTRSLASLRPRPETISRTTLITPIFFSPAPPRTTSKP